MRAQASWPRSDAASATSRAGTMSCSCSWQVAARAATVRAESRNVCQRWPEMRNRGALLSGGRRLSRNGQVHRPLLRHLVLCRVCGGRPLLAGEDRHLRAAGRCGHVRLRRADRRRRCRQHGRRAAGRRGGGDRSRRRRPVLHAGCAHGGSPAHHRGRSLGREAGAGAPARRHRHLQRGRSGLRRPRSVRRRAAASTTPSRWRAP